VVLLVLVLVVVGWVEVGAIEAGATELVEVVVDVDTGATEMG
jgi:hypothetical protein